MSNQPNISWPGWEVVRTIGHGSFGAVYEIQRNTFGYVESAALKVITIPDKASDIEDLYNDGYTAEDVTARFQGYLADIVREYSLMVDMKGHPNVVYCDDFRYVQHEDGIGWDIYIKMELLTPLTKALPKAIDEQTVIDLGIDVCGALVMCKERNIVHRDIKPQNIFVSKDGAYKLGDFGIAKTAERTTSGTKIGTYKYMAPEVYNNQPYGASADIYSLGLLMYWMLNERRTPFLPLPPQVPSTSMEDEARKRRFLGESFPAPAHGSKELKEIVLKACAYDPKERFASAAEMREALLRLERDGVAAAPVVAAADEVEEKSGATAGAAVITGAAVPVMKDAPEPAAEPVSQPEPAARPVPESKSEPKAEPKKKKGKPFVWIALAAVLALVIGVGAVMGGGAKSPVADDKTPGQEQQSDKEEQADKTDESEKDPQTDKADESENDQQSQQSSKPLQVEWTKWAQKLPEDVTDADYEIEKRILYRSRKLEKKTSTQKTLDGWERYDSASSGKWGAWSDWETGAVSASDTRQVETKTQYRYRDKETTTSSDSNLSGWELYDTTYAWSDYGSWSSWSTDAVTASDSRAVEKKTQYRSRDIAYTTEYTEWGSWSSWSFDRQSTSDLKKEDSRNVWGYYYYTCPNCGAHMHGWNIYCPTWAGGCGKGWITENMWTQVYSTTSWDSAGLKDWHGTGKYYAYVDGQLVFKWTDGGSGTQYRYASRSTEEVKVYSDWSSWGDTTISASGTREVNERTVYRYRDRTQIPTYYYERWGGWSSWDSSSVSESESRQVESATLYRYRDKTTSTTYYFRRWTAWSEYSEQPISASDSVEVEKLTQYRYRSKQ